MTTLDDIRNSKSLVEGVNKANEALKGNCDTQWVLMQLAMLAFDSGQRSVLDHMGNRPHLRVVKNDGDVA